MKKILIVIDMQNDYLWEKRMKKFAYDTKSAVANKNEVIEEMSESGCDVVYIRHIIQNLPTNRLLFGYSIAGSEGAEIYGGIKMVSENVFDKLFPDAFRMKDFREFIKDGGYDTAAIIGLDECGCVSATAEGAVKNGLSVEMITKGIFTVFPEKKREKRREKLKGLGVKYI